MKNQFKKLFDISYKEKKFTIFVDENHRYTFLEKNKEGKYLYPTIEDFISLNNIYNVHDPFVLKSARKYTFNEKVKVGALILSLSVLTTYSGAKNTIDNKEELGNFANEEDNWKVSVGEEEVAIENNSISQQIIPISSLSDLDNILPFSKVDLEYIDKAIEINNTLDANFKNLSHNLAVAIYDNSPNADLRIYYANLLTLKAVEMSEEEYYEMFKDHSGATYRSSENKIYYKEGIGKETLVHELSHTTYSIFVRANNQTYCHKSGAYHALNEIMNNKIVDLVTPATSYSYLRPIGDYLFTFAKFDFNRYMDEGPNYILNDIKEKYTNIDVSYINDSLNAMKDSDIELGEKITIEECPDLIEELFKLCKEKAKEKAHGENIYISFLEFANLFPNNEELFTKYLNEYNTYLETLQRNTIISEEKLEKKIDPYKNINGFLWSEEILYPCISSDIDSGYDIIIQNGKEQERIRTGGYYFSLDSNISLPLKKEFLENPNLEINSEFWKTFTTQNNYISPSYLYKTTILLNGKTLAEDFLENLKIQIGLTSTNQIGFIIMNSYNEIIYQSEEDLKNVSPSVSLIKYYSVNLDNMDKLELTNILNESYLKEVQTNKILFKNLFVDKEEITLEPYHFLTICKESGGKYGVHLNQCLLFPSEKNFEVTSSTTICLNLETPFEEPFYLKDVLNYYNLLEDSQITYAFTEEEIKELIEKYIEEMNYTQTR